MAPTTNPFRGLPLTAAIVFSVLASTSAQLQYTAWTIGEAQCPAGLGEVLKEVHGPTKQTKKLCGPPENLEKYKKQFGACRSTDCGDASTPNLCATMNQIFIDNKKVAFGDEINRDKCTIKNGGGTGAVALCCPEGSLETVLASTYGANQHEFPHQAKLRLPGHCGGTVYNKRWIVTAAHCIVGKEDYKLKGVKDMEVVLGTNNGDAKDAEYVYKVKRAVPHEGYSRLKGSPEFKNKTMIYNDIALLELTKDIKFSDSVKSLEIADANFDPYEYAGKTVIVGWGTTDTLEVSMNLQKSNFALRSDHTCFEYSNDAAHPHYNFVEKQLLCVGGVRDGTWSPTAGGGDSGGPAICRGEDGKAVLCGVTSFGGSDEECAAKGDQASCPPSVYAEVAYFHDWIKEHAGNQDPSTFYKPYVYGQPAKADHQVHITSKSGKSCGGTLVAPDIVVTAAQCVLKEDRTTHSGLKVHYGVTDLNGDAQGKVFTLKGATMLPTWKNSFKVAPYLAKQDKPNKQVLLRDDYYKDDVAVIKLNKKAPIAASKLPGLASFEDTFQTGREFSLPRNTTISGEMRSREFKLLSQSDCQKRYNRLKGVGLNVKVDNNVLCGVEKYSGGSECDRELGGGLICQKGGKDVLCGVQVFRTCTWSVPNGFMNMMMYGDWVKDAMSQL